MAGLLADADATLLERDEIALETDAAELEAIATVEPVPTAPTAEVLLLTATVVRDPVPTMEEGSEAVAEAEGENAAVVAVLTTGRGAVVLVDEAELKLTTVELTDVVVLTEVEIADPALETTELVVDTMAEELVTALGQVRSKRGPEAKFEPIIPKLGGGGALG